VGSTKDYVVKVWPRRSILARARVLPFTVLFHAQDRQEYMQNMKTKGLQGAIAI
jgi:hypothetical protein